jgi:DNA-binding transcriptional MerR regulator
VGRDSSGRRVYSERHLGWLDLMERLRVTGMSIAQMREYTELVRQGERTLKQRQELLSAHRARVTATIAGWTVALRLIDTKIDFYGQWLATGQQPAMKPQRRSAHKRRRQNAPRSASRS